MRLRAISAALAVAAALSAGCDVRVGENGVSVDVSSGRARDEWTRTYTITKGGSLEVLNLNGPIAIEKAAGDQVELQAIRQTRASSDEEAQDLLNKLEIKEEVTPGRVVLQTSTPSTSFGRRSGSVEYHVKVPPGLQITAKTENGGVTLTDVQGRVTASTTNGGIRGSNISGSLSAHIVNGGIVADMASVDGEIQLDAVNGGIRVDLPPTLKADLQASAVNGGVSVDKEFTVSGGERSRNRVSGKLNGGGPAVTATTVNGGVSVRARREGGPARTDEDAKTEAGPVVVER